MVLHFKKSSKEQAVFQLVGGNGYMADNISISDFIANGIQSYSTIPVVNETMLTESYDFDFHFDLLPGSAEFTENLKKCGLQLQKTRRKAPALFLYK